MCGKILVSLMQPEINIKRIYSPPGPNDGKRILVDRLWPRGIKKDNAKIDLWLKDIAPSDELRKWFMHDPAKWEKFRDKYFLELKGKRYLCKELLSTEKNKITLLFGAKDEKHSQAAALKDFLENNFF